MGHSRSSPPRRSAAQARAVGVASLLVALSVQARAGADPGDACVTSYEGAQRARKDGGLVKSKAELRLCLGACPGLLATDCRRWLAEVEASLGRLTVRAVDSSGAAVEGARVLVDGVERPVGVGFEIDPGAHHLRVEAPGFEVGSGRAEIAAGQTSTSTIRLQPVATASAVDLAPPMVLGGVGVGALLAAGALSLAGHLDVSDMRSDSGGCAPRCPEDRVDQVRAMWIAGGVLAGLGGAALVGAGAWLGVALTSEGTTRVAITPLGSGAGLGVGGAF